MLSIRHFVSGETRSLEIADLPAALLEGSVWIDLSEPTPSEFDSVAALFNWHSLAIEDCRVENHLPKIDDYQDHLLIVLHGVDVEASSSRFESKEVEIFIAQNYLVTHHRQPMVSTVELESRCERNPALAAKGPAYMLYLLLDSMSDIYLPYLDQLDDRIDTVEQDLLAQPGKQTLERIYGLRRDVIGLRRVVTPQLEVMRRLGRETEFPVIPQEAVVYFRDIYDDLFRITQAADSYRELLAGALDSYLSALSNEMNQVMKVLTVFSSIMLPLTFLAGVWGMNFQHMPEIPWRYGYAFALSLMAITAAGLLWFFKRRNWL